MNVCIGIHTLMRVHEVLPVWITHAVTGSLRDTAVPFVVTLIYYWIS
ncbi:MAG TPA: hypothetical protein VMW77_07250 [Methanoregula sp.]|nr:hypothetical protein [Methanoregula sp.]